MLVMKLKVVMMDKFHYKSEAELVLGMEELLVNISKVYLM